MTEHISEQEEVRIKTTLMNFIKDNFVFEGNPEALRMKLYDTNELLFETVMVLFDKTPNNVSLDDNGDLGTTIGVR